jgi:hypothetical protein
MKEVPWVAPQHDVDSFFKTGVTYNNNISISRAFEKTEFGFLMEISKQRYISKFQSKEELNEY